MIQQDVSTSLTYPTAHHCTPQVCGAAGSRWKMYVSPVHAVMIFHNVETNEEIWDYKAKDKDLLRVVEDNIVGLEGISAKAAAVEEQAQEWEKLLRDRFAM